MDGKSAGFDATLSGADGGGAVLVRPDGVIGFRTCPADEPGLAALDQHLVKLSRPPRRQLASSRWPNEASMPAVACLIANRERHPLDDRVAAEATRLLKGSVRWLADAEAVEIMAPEIGPGEAAARLTGLLDDQPLDYAVLPTHHRRKRLLLCDMDSTMITIECIDELADFAGIKAGDRRRSPGGR